MTDPNMGASSSAKSTSIVGSEGTKESAFTSILQPLTPNELFERQMAQIDKGSHLLTSEAAEDAFETVLAKYDYNLERDNKSAQILAGRSEVTKFQTAIAYIKRLQPNSQWTLLPPEAQWEYVKNHIPSLQSRLASSIMKLVPSIDSPDDAFTWLQKQADKGHSLIEILDNFSTMELEGGLTPSTRALNQAWIVLLSQWSLPNLPPNQWISTKAIEAWKSLAKFKSQWPALMTIIQGFDEARQILIATQAAMSIPEQLDGLIEEFGVNPNQLAEAMAHLRQTPVISDLLLKQVPLEWQIAFNNITSDQKYVSLLLTMHDVQKWLNDQMDLNVSPFTNQSVTWEKISHWAKQLFTLPEYALFSPKLIEQAGSIMSLQSSIVTLKTFVNSLPDYHRGIVLLHIMLARPDLAPATSGLIDWSNPTFLTIMDKFFLFALSELPHGLIQQTPLVESNEIVFSLKQWREEKPEEPPEWVATIEQFDPTLAHLFLFGVGFPVTTEYFHPQVKEKQRRKTVSEEDEEDLINQLLEEARNSDRNVNNLFNIWGIDRLEDVIDLLPIGQRDLVKLIYRKFPELAYRLILCSRLRIDPRMIPSLDRNRIANLLSDTLELSVPLPKIWFE